MKLSAANIKGLLWSMTLGTAFMVAGCGSSSGGAPSNEPPTATITQPLQDASGLPINPLVNVVFSSLMDPTSINEDTIYLMADGSDEIIYGSAVLADDGYTAVFTTASELLPGDVYNIVVDTEVRDQLGNHPTQDLVSSLPGVGDGARIVVPVAMPLATTVAEGVLDSEVAQYMNTTLSSMLGTTEGLGLSGEDLSALADSAANMTLNDFVGEVQALNPEADTVEELMNTPLSLGTALDLLTENLPEGPASDAVQAVMGDIVNALAVAPGELLGQSITLAEVLTLPTDLLPLDPTSTSFNDALDVAANPLALLEGIAQAVDAGAIVEDSTLGPVIASVLTQAGTLNPGSLNLAEGVLTQVPGTAELSSLIPADLQELADTILTSADPLAVVDTLLNGDGGGLLGDLLGGLGLATLTDLLDTAGLADAEALAAELLGILEGLDPTATGDLLGGLEGVLGSLPLPAL